MENALLADETWGPVLDRYQELRFREDVLAALDRRGLDVPPRHVVTVLNAQLAGSGGLALGPGAVAAGAEGLAIGGDVLGDVVQAVVERLVVEVTVPQPGPGKDSLRTAYLNHLFETTGYLSLAGVDHWRW